MRTHEIIALGVLLLTLAGGIFALVEVDFRIQLPATPESSLDWDSVTDDPDFMSRQQSFPLTAAVFQSGRVGYINYTGYYAEMLNVNGSFAYQTYQLQPDAELVPGNVMIGPYGRGVTRIWGGGGHSLTFGLQVAEKPQIVLRVLRMLETWATDARFPARRAGAAV